MGKVVTENYFCDVCGELFSESDRLPFFKLYDDTNAFLVHTTPNRGDVYICHGCSEAISGVFQHRRIRVADGEAESN